MNGANDGRPVAPSIQIDAFAGTGGNPDWVCAPIFPHCSLLTYPTGTSVLIIQRFSPRKYFSRGNHYFMAWIDRARIFHDCSRPHRFPPRKSTQCQCAVRIVSNASLLVFVRHWLDDGHNRQWVARCFCHRCHCCMCANFDCIFDKNSTKHFSISFRVCHLF